MELVPGKAMAYAAAGELGEDGGDGTGHPCDSTTTVVTNCTKAVIVLTNVFSEAGAILVPPEVTPVSTAIGAAVKVVSNGKHEMITTITPCTHCGEPKASVTTNNVPVTPSIETEEELKILDAPYEQ